MPGFIDLHSHFVPGIDDGVRSVGEGVALLRGLYEVGYRRVIATPHMRPGMFDNDRGAIEAAFAAFAAELRDRPGLPEIGLSSEHYLDDVIFDRIAKGEALPYPGNKAVLLELHADIFPVRLAERAFDVRRRGMRVVLAHPERYAAVGEKPSILEPLLDGGMLLLLDVMALGGKYGRRAQRTAERMLADGWYYAACTDAHREGDAPLVRDAIARLRALAGDEEAEFLLSEGPKHILEGSVET